MLAGVAFPTAYPDAPRFHLWLAGLSATLLFFGSVLAHELSHSLVARALGLEVIGITLFVFGGVSSLAADPEDGWTEIKVAAAGPLLSFCLAATFLVLALVASAAEWISPLAAAVLYYLAVANGLLALFNLVPGFPLDGGRMLRAIWWIRTGSLPDATRVATGVGSGVAVLLIALGAIQALRGNLGGLWLVLIGLFLRSAAGAARREMELRQRLVGATAGDVMFPDPPVIPIGVTAGEALTDWFLRFGLDGFPVIENGLVCGLVGLESLNALPVADREHRTVGEMMTPLASLLPVLPEEPVRQVKKRIAR